MTKFMKPLLTAGLLAAIATPLPASAQVNGIATASTAGAVASTKAFGTAFNQIESKYAADITLIQQRRQSMMELLTPFDANKDGRVTPEERAAVPQATQTQLTAYETEINQKQVPIQIAQMYVVSQIAQQFQPAVQQVINDKGIQLLIAPSAVMYGPTANVTADVASVLDTRVPTATIDPPANWGPNQAIVDLYDEIQDLLMLTAMAQQQQAAAASAPQQQQQQPAATTPVQRR